MEKSPTFKEWLLRQCDRDDEIGDLADDVKHDRAFPKAVNTCGNLTAHLRRQGAMPEAVAAAKAAWREYEQTQGIPR